MRRRYLPGRVVLLLLIFCVVILLGTYFLFWPMTSSIHTAQTCAAASAIAKTSATSTQLAPPLYLGLDAYRHWDKLSYLEVGDRIEGQSTADTGGSNADNTHTLGVLPNDEHVLFDQVGLGIVTFMRMQENYGAPWKLSLDGHSINTVAPHDFGQMKPDSLPASAFPYPLSLNPQESQGSSILATALPFRQSLTWASQHHNGNFYALYRKLPYGTALNTWSSHTSVNNVVGLLRCAGSNIAPATLSQQSRRLALVSGKEASVVTLSGPAQIRSLSFSIPRSEMVHLGNVRLRVRWDGETHPSVDAPLKFLIGDGAGVYQPVGRSLVQG